VTKAEFENPEYEIARFGMLTGKACELISKTYMVWIPLLNEEMKKYQAGMILQNLKDLGESFENCTYPIFRI